MKYFNIFSVREQYPELKEIHLNIINQLVIRYNHGEMDLTHKTLISLPKHKINTPISEVFKYYKIPTKRKVKTLINK